MATEEQTRAALEARPKMDQWAPWMAEHRPSTDWQFFGWDDLKLILQWARTTADDKLEILTQQFGTDALLDHNRELESASNGRAFGDGQIVARIPETIFHSSGLARAVREKDRRFIGRFLNDADNSRFRTFRGNV